MENHKRYGNCSLLAGEHDGDGAHVNRKLPVTMMGIRIATMTTVFARKHIVMDYKGLEEGVPPRTHVCRHTWLDLELLQSLAVFIISAWLASESRAKRKTCQVDFYFFFYSFWAEKPALFRSC